MKRGIRKLVVVGAGLMGTQIAALFAHLGMEVSLLDRPDDREPESPGFSRSRIAEQAWERARKAKPAILYLDGDARRIRTGNWEDDQKDMADADWIVEAVTERPEIKKSVLDGIEKHRREDALVTTNTSGLSIAELAQGRSESFRRHFAGMHFFNPPRYLKLVELISGPDTDPNIMDFLDDFAHRFLGKVPIRCRDTPAFIANRIGVYAFLEAFHLMEDQKLTIEEVDFLTGPLWGRPKSATFRTADWVGLDTLALVARHLQEKLPQEAALGYFVWPHFAQSMLENQWLGEKTQQGFYKKQRGEQGTEIWSLRWETMEYGPRQNPEFPEIGAETRIPLEDRIPRLYGLKGRAGDFFRAYLPRLLAYSSSLVPTLSDDPYAIDQALRHGFGWTLGPFEIWDILGVERMGNDMKAAGRPPAPWVDSMLASGRTRFYQAGDQGVDVYSPTTDSATVLEEPMGWTVLRRLPQRIIWTGPSARLYDLGEETALLGWETKMNAIGAEVISAIHRALDWAESRDYGLILSNSGPSFSAGADLAYIFMLALEKEFDELAEAVVQFQRTSLRIRYSSVPVVVAPHGMTLGGGLEFCLHADQVVAAAETYMGLVELGVGLIPAGGGTKEMARRASERIVEGDIEINDLNRYFRRLGMAEVSGSAQEAMEWGYLRPNWDLVLLQEDLRISQAKWTIRAWKERGYRPPSPGDKIKVQGRAALGGMLAGLHGMRRAGRISEYDQFLAQKLAWVICGGDLSQPSWVNESYLMDLEREAFLQVCGERKTLERLEAMMKTGKPLRN